MDTKSSIGTLQSATVQDSCSTDGSKSDEWCQGTTSSTTSAAFTPFQLTRARSEPPIFNYDRLVRERIPSPIRLHALYPDSVTHRTTFLDLTTEEELLLMYSDSISQILSDTSADEVDQAFYVELLKNNLELDSRQVQKEILDLERDSGVSDLERFAFQWMDNEGKMGILCKALQERGEAVFMGWPTEVGDEWRWMLDGEVPGDNGNRGGVVKDVEWQEEPVMKRYRVMSVPGTPRLRVDAELVGLIGPDDCDWGEL